MIGTISETLYLWVCVQMEFESRRLYLGNQTLAKVLMPGIDYVHVALLSSSARGMRALGLSPAPPITKRAENWLSTSPHKKQGICTQVLTRTYTWTSVFSRNKEEAVRTLARYSRNTMSHWRENWQRELVEKMTFLTAHFQLLDTNKNFPSALLELVRIRLLATTEQLESAVEFESNEIMKNLVM